MAGIWIPLSSWYDGTGASAGGGGGTPPPTNTYALLTNTQGISLSKNGTKIVLTKYSGSTDEVDIGGGDTHTWDSTNKKLTIHEANGNDIVIDLNNSVDVLDENTPPAYNSTNKTITFTWSNGHSTTMDVSDLVTVQTDDTIDGDGTGTTPLKVIPSTDVGNSLKRGSDGRLFVEAVSDVKHEDIFSGDGTDTDPLDLEFSSDADNLAKKGTDNKLFVQRLKAKDTITGTGDVGDEFEVFISTDAKNIIVKGTDKGLYVETEIDDTKTILTKTWSSKKIDEELDRHLRFITYTDNNFTNVCNGNVDNKLIKDWLKEPKEGTNTANSLFTFIRTEMTSTDVKSDLGITSDLTVVQLDGTEVVNPATIEAASYLIYNKSTSSAEEIVMEAITKAGKDKRYLQFWDKDYTGYTNADPKNKIVVADDGLIYLAQRDPIPVDRNPVDDDGTNWLPAFSERGEFTGGSETFATLPDKRLDGSLLRKNDHAFLTKNDVGTGDNFHPQYPAGIYTYNPANTSWELKDELDPTGKDSVFIPDSDVNPVKVGRPTITEIKTAIAGKDYTRAVLYYNGTDTDDKDSTAYAYYVDRDGEVIPLGKKQDERLHIFAKDSVISPATAGEPTLAEIKTYATNNNIKDRFIEYNGTDTDDDDYTRIYHIDDESDVILVEKKKEDKLHTFIKVTDLNPADTAEPTISEIETYASNNKLTDIFLTYNATDTDNNDYTRVYHIDDNGDALLAEKKIDPIRNPFVEVTINGTHTITDSILYFEWTDSAYTLKDKDGNTLADENNNSVNQDLPYMKYIEPDYISKSIVEYSVSHNGVEVPPSEVIADSTNKLKIDLSSSIAFNYLDTGDKITIRRVK